MLSCFFWGYAFTQLFAGTIADRFSGERILRITTLLWALLTFFTPQLFDLAYSTHSPLFFVIIVRIFIGIGQGSLFSLIRSYYITIAIFSIILQFRYFAPFELYFSTLLLILFPLNEGPLFKKNSSSPQQLENSRHSH